MPFPNFTMVMPSASSVRRPLTAPAGGGVSISARVEAVSVHAATGAAFAVANAPCSSVSLGTWMFGFCGDTARMTRLVSASSDFAMADASFTLMPGRSCATSLCSYAMPGLGSSSRKFRRYSSANDPLSVLSRSLYACS